MKTKETKQQKIQRAAELLKKKEELERLLFSDFKIGEYNESGNFRRAVFDTDINEEVDSLVKEKLKQKLKSVRAKIGHIKL